MQRKIPEETTEDVEHTSVLSHCTQNGRLDDDHWPVLGSAERVLDLDHQLRTVAD